MIPRDRPKRAKKAKERMDEQLWNEMRAEQAYQRYRARGVDRRGGQRFRRPPRYRRHGCGSASVGDPLGGEEPSVARIGVELTEFADIRV